MKKYTIKGNHPTLKYVNLEINCLDELPSKIGKLLANGYKVTIESQPEYNGEETKTEQIDKVESLGDILRSAYPALKARGDKMEPKDIEGKKIKKIIDKNTQICDKFINYQNNTIINLAYKAGTAGNITILCGNNYVFIFDKEKLKTMFYVYDLEYVTTNDKRGLIIAGGRETTHEYWLDNGEYHKNYIR